MLPMLRSRTPILIGSALAAAAGVTGALVAAPATALAPPDGEGAPPGDAPLTAPVVPPAAGWPGAPAPAVADGSAEPSASAAAAGTRGARSLPGAVAATCVPSW